MAMFVFTVMVIELVSQCCESLTVVESQSSQHYAAIRFDSVPTFSEANSYCNDTYGTTLASIHSDNDTNEWLSISNNGYGCWIGLTEYDRSLGKYNGWKWQDNTSTNYINWVSSEPNEDDQHCVMAWGNVYSSGNHLGQWRDIDCDGSDASSTTLHCIICNYNPTASPTLIPTVDPTVDPTEYATPNPTEMTATTQTATEITSPVTGQMTNQISGNDTTSMNDNVNSNSNGDSDNNNDTSDNNSDSSNNESNNDNKIDSTAILLIVSFVIIFLLLGLVIFILIKYKENARKLKETLNKSNNNDNNNDINTMGQTKTTLSSNKTMTNSNGMMPGMAIEGASDGYNDAYNDGNGNNNNKDRSPRAPSGRNQDGAVARPPPPPPPPPQGLPRQGLTMEEGNDVEVDNEEGGDAVIAMMPMPAHTNGNDMAGERDCAERQSIVQQYDNDNQNSQFANELQDQLSVEDALMDDVVGHVSTAGAN